MPVRSADRFCTVSYPYLWLSETTGLETQSLRKQARIDFRILLCYSDVAV